jgi:Holliday junction resolvase
MKRKSYAKRRDENEPEIVKALEGIGAKVIRLDIVDLLVNYRGKIYLLEVKTPEGKLTKKQRELLDDGWPIHIVRDIGGAYLAVGAIAA